MNQYLIEIKRYCGGFILTERNNIQIKKTGTRKIYFYNFYRRGGRYETYYKLKSKLKPKLEEDCFIPIIKKRK